MINLNYEENKNGINDSTETQNLIKLADISNFKFPKSKLNIQKLTKNINHLNLFDIKNNPKIKSKGDLIFITNPRINSTKKVFSNDSSFIKSTLNNITYKEKNININKSFSNKNNPTESDIKSPNLRSIIKSPISINPVLKNTSNFENKKLNNLFSSQDNTNINPYDSVNSSFTSLGGSKSNINLNIIRRYNSFSKNEINFYNKKVSFKNLLNTEKYPLTPSSKIKENSDYVNYFSLNNDTKTKIKTFSSKKKKNLNNQQREDFKNFLKLNDDIYNIKPINNIIYENNPKKSDFASSKKPEKLKSEFRSGKFYHDPKYCNITSNLKKYENNKINYFYANNNKNNNNLFLNLRVVTTVSNNTSYPNENLNTELDKKLISNGKFFLKIIFRNRSFEKNRECRYR